MISVIISTYKRPELLKRAIQSVLDQSYQDFEIIVVHDGLDIDIDTDLVTQNDKTTFYSIEHFGNDTRPKNEGIRLASGEYIALLDDDNTFRKDHLQVLHNAIKDTDLDVVYGDRMLVWDDNSNKPQIGIYSDFSPSLLFKRNYIDTSDSLIRKEALLKIGGFDERFGKYVDWNLYLRLAKAGCSFKHVSLIITDYHIHDTMKSATKKTDNEKLFEEWFGQTNFLPDWKKITKKDPTDFGAYDLEIELDYIGKKKEPRVGIFSLTYDRLEYTKACFESLYKTAGYEFTHVIVDNGSTDGTKEWLIKQSLEKDNLIVIRNPENRGISIASNQALDIMKNYDIIVKVDNDCLFTTDGWLSEMVNIWKSNHKIALSCYVNGLRDNPGGAQRIGFGNVNGELIGMTRHLGGICHFVDASAYKKFRWDTHDFLHGLQDVELSRYLLNQGWQMGYLENYFCEHIDGTEGQHTKYPEYFERRKKEKTTRA